MVICLIDSVRRLYSYWIIAYHSPCVLFFLRDWGHSLRWIWNIMFLVHYRLEDGSWLNFNLDAFWRHGRRRGEASESGRRGERRGCRVDTEHQKVRMNERTNDCQCVCVCVGVQLNPKHTHFHTHHCLAWYSKSHVTSFIHIYVRGYIIIVVFFPLYFRIWMCVCVCVWFTSTSHFTIIILVSF